MIRTIYGRFPTMNMQTPSLRSSHLDIKDVQCAETKDVLKISYQIISRLGVFELWASIRSKKMRENLIFFQK